MNRTGRTPRRAGAGGRSSRGESVTGPVLAAALALAVAACSPRAVLPEGVSARVYQTRSDVAAGNIEIQVHNGTDQPLTISGARVDSPHLAVPAEYAGRAVIPAQAVMDLKAPLPPSSCSASEGQPRVTLEFAIDGTHGSQEIGATDSLEQLPAIARAYCRQRAVADVVQMTPPLSVPGSVGSEPLTLRYRLSPTGDHGRVRFLETGPTTLLTPATAAGRVRTRQVLNVTVTGSRPPTHVTLRYAPARCDAHAVAEDKQGTLLSVQVSVDGQEPGPVTLPVPDQLRAAIHSWVATRCGLS